MNKEIRSQVLICIQCNPGLTFDEIWRRVTDRRGIQYQRLVDRALQSLRKSGEIAYLGRAWWAKGKEP